MFYCILIVNPIIFLCTTIVGTLIIIVAMLLGEKAAAPLPIIFSRVICFFVPIIIKVENKEKLKKGESFIIVMNHKSNADIITLWAALGIQLRWVMKAELLKVPIFGHASIRSGNIPIDRRNTNNAMKSIYSVKEKLSDGSCIVFFPEGTRSKPDVLIGKFKKGAFHLSLDTNIPILPVTVAGTEKVLPKNSFLCKPGRVKVIIHDPVYPGDYDKQSVNAFSDKVHEIISETLKKEKRSVFEKRAERSNGQV